MTGERSKYAESGSIMLYPSLKHKQKSGYETTQGSITLAVGTTQPKNAEPLVLASHSYHLSTLKLDSSHVIE